MKKTILIGMTLGALFSCGTQEDAKTKSSNLKGDDDRKTLCNPDGLPNDWVIVGHVNSINCRTSPIEWNAYVVKKAGAKEVVCSDSNIPRGYVKLRTLNTGNCGIAFRDNAYEIEKL